MNSPEFILSFLFDFMIVGDFAPYITTPPFHEDSVLAISLRGSFLVCEESRTVFSFLRSICVHYLKELAIFLVTLAAACHLLVSSRSAAQVRSHQRG